MLLSVDSTNIYVRSPKCTISLSEPGVCSACLGLTPEIDVVKHGSRAPPGKRQVKSLSHAQIVEKVRNLTELVNKHKEEVSGQIFTTTPAYELQQSRNLAARLVTAPKKLGHYEDFHHIVAQNDVKGLQRLFRIADRQQWSIKKLCAKTRDVIAGGYHPYSYSAYERDLAILTYELGGGPALYAHNHASTSLPSRDSIAPLRRQLQLQISIGGMKMSDILTNIETLFGGVKPRCGRTGITLCQDEIACESRLCYLPETDEIAGLCEHSKALGSLKMGSDLSTIDAVATAVRKTKEVHVGHEVSVAAFAKLDADDYGAKPVLLLPTCKKGDYRDAALQLQMLLEAWKISPYGARLHGDVWSIASDGDPKRRPALYLLCMARKLVETDALYKHVGRLRGLNLYCGRNFETAAFDWKHN